jgi:Domain of unknown function (DUF397).
MARGRTTTEADAHLHGVVWRKSTRSGENGGNCVEVAAVRGAVAVRDSKDSSGPVLVFPPDEWRATHNALKHGQTIN